MKNAIRRLVIRLLKALYESTVTPLDRVFPEAIYIKSWSYQFFDDEGNNIHDNRADIDLLLTWGMTADFKLQLKVGPDPNKEPEEITLVLNPIEKEEYN